MKRSLAVINFIKVVLLMAFMFFCTMSYHPFVYSVSQEFVDAGEAVISPFLSYIRIILVLLVILSFIKNEGPILNKHLSKYIFLVFLLLIFALLLFGVSPQKHVSGDIKAILTCLFAFFVGYHLNMSESWIKKLLFYYGLLVCIVGLFQILVNIGGFVVLESYETDGKNALGAMLSVSAVIFWGIALSKTGSRFERIFALLLGLLSLVELLTIRARLATLSAIGVVFLMFYFLKNRKKIKPLPFLFISFVLIVLIFIVPNPLYNYIYDSLFLNKEGDITAGRTTMNLQAIKIILDNPLVANLYDNYINVDIRVHNWMLKRLYEYGLVFAIPFVIIYLKLGLALCKQFLNRYNDTFQILGYAMVAALFVISLGEPNMPFSPGTAMTTAYIFWGYSYQRLKIIKN